MAFGFRMGYPTTRGGTGTGPANLPAGAYQIKEKVTGTADNTARTLKSGVWGSAQTDAVTALERISIDGFDFPIGGPDIGLSDLSRRWVTGDAASKEWFVELTNTATGTSASLVNFGVVLIVQIERSPTI